jgi:hypothetical protein
MNITKFTITSAALSASFLLSAPLLNAQDATTTTPAATATPAQSGSGAPGGGTVQDIMQRILERRDAGIKTALKVSDDEWAVIQPLLDKEEQAQFAYMMTGNYGFGIGGGRRGGNGGAGGAGGAGPGGNPMFQGSPEVQALNDAAQSDATSNDDLKTKMAAVRDARKKAEDDLAAARANLQKVLTLRQEAVLLSMGVLD